MILGQSIFVFDIETITDIKAGQHLYGLDLSTDDAKSALAKLCRQETGSDFPRLPLHEIVCISGLWLDENGIKLFSWTQEHFTEVEILEHFVAIFEHHHPILVSWNGSQFDLPVIMQRCLYHGVSAAKLFEQGEQNTKKRHDNYQNRYQLRHTDLIDILANFNIKNFQKLDDVAQILGYPGKRIAKGYHVATHVQQQNWQILSRHCEGDVLNTWLVYLRWLLVRGFILKDEHRYWIQATIQYLHSQPHQQEFLQYWQTSCLKTQFTANDF